MGRKQDALQKMQEAVDRIWPYFEQIPTAFRPRTEMMLSTLLEMRRHALLPMSTVLQRRISTFQRLTGSRVA